MRELPIKWKCKVTEDNISVLNQWRLENAQSHTHIELKVNDYVLSRHLNDRSLFCSIEMTDHKRLPDEYNDYVELNTAEFKRLVLNAVVVSSDLSSNLLLLL